MYANLRFRYFRFGFIVVVIQFEINLKVFTIVLTNSTDLVQFSKIFWRFFDVLLYIALLNVRYFAVLIRVFRG